MHEEDNLCVVALWERVEVEERKVSRGMWNAGGFSRTSGHIISSHIRADERGEGEENEELMTPRNEATAILKLLSYFSFATIALSATLWKPQKSLNRPWQAGISISNDKSHRQRLKVFNKSWSCFVFITSEIDKIWDRQKSHWKIVKKSSANAWVLIEFSISHYHILKISQILAM